MTYNIPISELVYWSHLVSGWAEIHVSIIFLEGSGINAALAPVNVGCNQTSCSRGNPNLLFLVNWRLISLPHSNLLSCKHCVPLDCSEPLEIISLRLGGNFNSKLWLCWMSWKSSNLFSAEVVLMSSSIPTNSSRYLRCLQVLEGGCIFLCTLKHHGSVKQRNLLSTGYGE